MKIKSCVAVIIGMLLIMSTVTAATFPDINNHWAKSSIEEMASKGIITGYTDGTFKPSTSVTKLQSLILIARILGVNEEENAKYVELAQEEYDSILTYYPDYKKEVAYLLYKGCLNTGELYKYISTSNKNMALKRYEAAILLTKALGKEEEVKNTVMVYLPYDDADSVPKDAKPYVNFVRNEKINGTSIMGGMSETEFEPLRDVDRATMAVMLHRVIQKNEETDSITRGTITYINEQKNMLSVKNVIDVVKDYTVTEDMQLRFDGSEAELSDFIVGGSAIVSLKEDELYMIEGISPDIDETVAGIITSISKSGTTKKIKLKIEDGNDTTTEQYTVDSDVTVTYDGKTSYFNKLSTSDYAKIIIKNGKVINIDAESKKDEVEGIVKEIVFEPDLTIVIEKVNGAEAEYECLDDVYVKKNSKTADLSDVRVGDEVELVLEYDKVKKVYAESEEDEAEGVIDEILISKSPSITIRVGDEKYTYEMIRNVDIKIDNKRTIDDEDVDIYDLRLGQTVELELESDMVVAIEAGSVAQSMQKTGRVEKVNESYGFINISVVDEDTGESTVYQVFIKDETRILDSTDPDDTETIDFDDIEEGNTVLAIGSTDSGVFEASTIILLIE